ncbi:MAG: PAS domain S-box protein [candidate division Zixibacteria bacterium]|nr:PAS domain S-box protein [candidate division Zixibacteria bacterium]
MKKKEKLPLIRLRLSYFIILALFLTVLMIIHSIYGLKRGQESMLAVMENSGANLLESLVFNAKTIIEGRMLLGESVRDNFIRSISNLQEARERGYLDSDYVGNEVWAADADGCIVVKSDEVFASYFGKLGIRSSEIVDSLLSADYLADDLEENEFSTFELQLGNEEAITVVSGVDDAGFSYFMFKTGKFLVSGWREFSITNLLDNISREPGIEYVLLQNYEGIIFASRKVERMIAIVDDPFLEETLQDSLTNSRITEFYDQEVLEVARPFFSQGSFNGILRLGLSMHLYNELTAEYRNRIYLLTAILILLTFLVIGALYLYQRSALYSESLSHTKEVHDKVLAQIPSGILEFDREGKILALNPAGEELLGCEPNQVIGKNIENVLPREIIAALHKNENRTRTSEVEFDRDDERRNVTIISSYIGDSQENAATRLALFYDITQLRRYQEQAKKDQRLKELGDMSAGVAHEIRNPLNAISIAVQRLREEFPSDGGADAQRLLHHLISETKRLNKIVEDFLLFARYSHQPGTSDLNELIRSVVQLVKPQADRQNVDLEYHLLNGATVNLHSEDMKKVMLNLILNAIDACDSGDMIVINVAESDSNRIKIKVSDTGKGIPEEIIDKIFQPYVSKKRGGTGLGLAIAHRIIKDADGDIVAENRPEGGAEFCITLPKG